MKCFDFYSTPLFSLIQFKYPDTLVNTEDPPSLQSPANFPETGTKDLSNYSSTLSLPLNSSTKLNESFKNAQKIKKKIYFFQIESIDNVFVFAKH